MLRTSTSLPLALALVACAGDVSGARTTSEASSVSTSTTTGTTEGASSPTDDSTESAPTTVELTSETTSHDDTSASTSTTSTAEGTSEDTTETGREEPFRVGIALKSLCSPDLTSVCGVTLDDRMVCWGNIDSPSYKVPPGKVKAVSPQCFMVVLENGELHRLQDYPSKPLALPPGPFELAGGDYPYGCAMAANNEMTCWVAEGYQMIEDPPPGPYLSLDDSRESNCQMCGLHDDGSLVCWKKPVAGDWNASCDALGWNGDAPGTYAKIMESTFDLIRVMNDAGQLVSFAPSHDEPIYIHPLFTAGGFVEAGALLGLKQSGDLLFYEQGMGDGVPVLPGAYTTFFGDQHGGCAIRQADSRVVCWGAGDYGQFDPPTE